MIIGGMYLFLIVLFVDCDDNINERVDEWNRKIIPF